MDSLCNKTKDLWQKGSSAALTADERQEVARHLQTCSRCRDSVRYRGFINLLRECMDNTSAPADEFFINLNKKKAALWLHPEEKGFTEVVAQKSWRLVPVMALVLLVLIGSVSYQYETIESMNQPLEEMLLFEDQQLSGQHVLNAIIAEEQSHGE
jgi:hypothetical protein